MATVVDSYIPPHMLSSPNEASISELAPLASQHHASDYNRLKFGFQGCPVKYLPLSIHLPDFFQELQQRQVLCSEGKAWWPCGKKAIPAPSSSPVFLGSLGVLPCNPKANCLQEEIKAAMTETLDRMPRPAPVFNHAIKTSSTHPINISSMIPFELVPLISSHISFSKPSFISPTVFEVPNALTLERLLGLCSTHRQIYPTLYPALTSPFQPQTSTTCLQSHRKVTAAMLSRSLSSLDFSPRRIKSEMNLTTPTIVLRESNSTLVPEKFSTTTQFNVSPGRLVVPRTAFDRSPTLPVVSSQKTTRDDTVTSILQHPQEPPNSSNVASTLTTFPPSSRQIGNLFLSSCPGKKVRLRGPVKGRGGICRDLDTDLRRIKELGVGCIICCLDDCELDLLGAPWTEYERLARSNGIDVLRLPMPEGLAPLSPAYLDSQLTKIVNSYTLHGVPVLVHCRGGVGRAGLIACCWLIRLGICGWVESGAAKSPLSGSRMPQAHELHQNATLRKDTVQFVRKIIAIVRERRSLKAVETYEQVRFLVDFVDYLRTGYIPAST